MKAISLWQPWASLWLTPAKIHETRQWPTKHRGWLVVHAAKRQVDTDSMDQLDGFCTNEFGNHWWLTLPVGALVGLVHIDDCVRTESFPPDYDLTDDYSCGNFAPGRYAWRRGLYRKFDNPIPYRGSQGIFDVPEVV